MDMRLLGLILAASAFAVGFEAGYFCERDGWLRPHPSWIAMKPCEVGQIVIGNVDGKFECVYPPVAK